MPERVYLVTINVTRTVVVNTATELHMQALDPQGERGSAAEWREFNHALMRNANEFIDDICENVTSVELDEEYGHEEPVRTNQKSDDPLEG
jgi:hypothetical protein